MGTAQPLSSASTLKCPFIILEAWRVGAQNRLGEVFGGLGLVNVILFPVSCKLQMGVHLHDIGFTTPKLAGVISSRRGAEGIGVVNVNNSDLSALAIFLVIFMGAEFFNAVGVGWLGTNRSHVSSFFVLPNDLQTRFADNSVQPVTVLNDCPNEKLAGILCIVKSTHHRFAQQVFAKGSEGYKNRFVVTNWENGTATVGVFEGIDLLRRKIIIGFHEIHFVDILSRLFSGLLLVNHLVLSMKFFKIFVEKGNDSGNCWLVVVEQIVNEFITVFDLNKDREDWRLWKQVRSF
mmetsp:Transcript_21812/g.44820  ORF Transcript_21812/g.44820 Transcript_21812/m.44820 type:complete len:291 (-) Transcript_21812:231-1103(-)